MKKTSRTSRLLTTVELRAVRGGATAKTLTEPMTTPLVAGSGPSGSNYGGVPISR